MCCEEDSILTILPIIRTRSASEVHLDSGSVTWRWKYIYDFSYRQQDTVKLSTIVMSAFRPIPSTKIQNSQLVQSGI